MPIVRSLFVLAFWLALIFALVMALLPQPPALPGNPGDEVHHALAFVTLTGLGRFAYPRAGTAALLFAFVGLGALIEVVQSIPGLGRVASFDDWLIDVAATVATLLVVEPLRRLFTRRAGSPPQHMIDEPA